VNQIEAGLQALEAEAEAPRTALANLGHPVVVDGETVGAPLGSLRVKPMLFQNRTAGGPEGLDEDHVGILAGLLSTVPRFDPMTVIEVGPSLYVVEGHHRREAYRQKLQDTEVVPVVVRRWTVREALAAAGADNAKAQLQMTNTERSEYAWKLVKLDRLGIVPRSKPEISGLTGVSPRTILTMRQEASGPENLDLLWVDILRGAKVRQEISDDLLEARREAEAEQLWQALQRTRFGHYLRRDPEIILLALRRNAPVSTKRLAVTLRELLPDDMEDDGADF